MWRNHEGYPDPTAGEALDNIARETHENAWRPRVFICSPYAGDVSANTEKARRYLRFAIDRGTIPFAPHLLYPQVLDDSDPEERALGVFFGLVWLGRCHELWVFGRVCSPGMAEEISCATRRGLPIHYFTTECEEVAQCMI